MSPLLKRFTDAPARPEVLSAEGCYLHLRDGRRLLDASSGWCSQQVLGYSHPEVLESMRAQLQKYTHLDVNHWENPQLEELATLLLSRAPAGLTRVYFCGTGGSEAVEAAMKLSYQRHYNEGRGGKKTFISREESFHGATLQTMALSGLDLFAFYSPLMPANFARVPLHYPLRGQKPGESADDYARRGARELEDKILEIGAENVAAFVGETMLGGLLGDVPPAPNYWKYIREVCARHSVHLILDEVYCGLGRSGRVYCCDWDGVTPDFICVAKALSAGYAPLSAVITTEDTLKSLEKGQKRVHGGHTFQGYALGVAAALAVQKIIHREATLSHIQELGESMRADLNSRLGSHPFFREVRGRGLQFSLEYQTPDNVAFAARLQNQLENEYSVVVSCKWHRVSFAPPFIMNRAQAGQVTAAVAAAFESVSQHREQK